MPSSLQRAHPDLSQGPADLQSAALTTELCTHYDHNHKFVIDQHFHWICQRPTIACLRRNKETRADDSCNKPTCNPHPYVAQPQSPCRCQTARQLPHFANGFRPTIAMHLCGVGWRAIINAATARGFEPLRAEPNGFRVHLLNHSDTLSIVHRHHILKMIQCCARGHR